MTKTEYIRTAGAYLKYSKAYTSIYNWIKPHDLKQMDFEVISPKLDPLNLVAIMGMMNDTPIYHAKILPEIAILCEYFKKKRLTFDKGVIHIQKLSEKKMNAAFNIQIVYRIGLIAENYPWKHRIIYDMRFGYLTDHFSGNKEGRKLVEAIREAVENSREALHDDPKAKVNIYLSESIECLSNLSGIAKKDEVKENIKELLLFFTGYPYGKNQFYKGFEFTADNVGVNLEIFDIDPAVILRKKLGIQI